MICTAHLKKVLCISCNVFFFFQAEDGIRDYKVTGVQTCALPIWRGAAARRGRARPRAHGVAAERRQGGARAVKALITGGRGGLGRAFAEALGDDAEVALLDLPEFDVGDPAAWRALEGSYDAAFLNAGVITGEGEMAALTDEQYRRAAGANLDGVVFGVRECAARLMPNGGSIVATASLAGLTATPMDPIYAATKHAVVGFVRRCAPQLAQRGSRLNVLCPGFTGTPIVVEEVRGVLDVPLIEPAFVAEAALQALHGDASGEAWVVQPNRIVQFRFPNIPGPR